MLEREKKKSKLIRHDKLGCLGLAAKHMPHFSLILHCNRTTGGLGTFAYSSLAPTSERGHSLHGECWQILTFLSVLKLETFLENNYLPFIILGRWAWEEWLQFAPSGALAALKTPDWSQITWNKGPNTLLDGPITVWVFWNYSFGKKLKLQVNLRATAVHSAQTNSYKNKRILQIRLKKTPHTTPVIPRENRRKQQWLKENIQSSRTGHRIQYKTRPNASIYLSAKQGPEADH